MADGTAAAPAVVTPTAPAAQPAGEAGKPAVAAKPAAQAERTLRLVIDGVEKTLTETQAITQLQKMGATDKRFQEATKKEQKLEAILKAFEEDPEAALAKLGKDPSKLISEHLAKKAKLDLLTPEQQEKAKLEAELATLKAQQAETEKEKLTAKQAEMDANAEQVMEVQMIEAAKRHNLEGNWETLEMMTEVALEAIELGLTSITNDQIAQEVLRRQAEHLDAREKKILSRMTPAQLIEYVGKDRFKLMLKESLKAIPGANSKPAAAKPPEAPKPANGKKYTPNEWMKAAKTGKI